MLFKRDHVRRGDQEYQKGNLRRAAELYLKAKRFRQAAEVYAELGKIDKAVAIYLDAGQPRTAADLLAAEGRYKEAIPQYEEAGAFARAAEACLKVQQLVRAGHLFERAKMYRRAAETFTKAGDTERALKAWEAASEALRGERSGAVDHALEKRIRELESHRAEILVNVGRYDDAARLLTEHGQIATAASLFERAGRFAKAAEAYLEAGRVTEALAAIERAPDANDEVRAEIYLNCAKHREAAEIFERMERFDAAANAWEGAEDWAHAADAWQKAEAYGRAGEFYSMIERFRDAGRCFAMADQHDKAAAAFAKAGDDQSAGDAYAAIEENLEAGRHYKEAGLLGAARDALQAVSSKHEDYAAASAELIPLLVDEGLIEAAEQRLKLLLGSDHNLASYELSYVQGRVEEGRGRYSEAETCYLKAHAGHHDYLDVSERLRDVRGKVSGVSESFLRPEPSDSSRDLRRDTSPVTKSPTEPMRRPSLPTSSPADELPSLDSSSMPFDIEERIDPWWSGAEFFRARDQRTQRGILLVSFPLAEVGSQVKAFRGAMRQVTAVSHPTILKLDETILASDKVLLVYEPFSGRALGGFLSQERLPALTCLNIIVQLAEALSTAHKLGVTHQWVSPRTVLIDEQGRLKLVGIGLRDVLADRDATSQAYLSPEVRDDGVVGPASDVYSLGLLAMELLKARMPAGWAQQSEVDSEGIEWPDDVLESVPHTARDALARSLSSDALARPSTAELAAALSSVGLIPGQILANRYEILGELGRGGMSRVYRARDRDLDDEVAIKTVLTPTLGPSEDEGRLWQEVKICRKISHPNVVRVHDFGRFPGGIFVTMELLDGPGLDVVIQEEAPLGRARVRDYLHGVSAALGEAHRLRIIHRDLKPSNVIVIGDRVKVLDFGIAHLGDDSKTTHLTRTGQVVGSPMFMAPEQIQGQPLAGTTDLYALGVMAYTLLAGREPFLGDNSTAIVMKHLNEEPPDILEFRPELDAEWVELLAKLLAKKPADRYQSAEEVQEALATLPV